MEPQMPRLPRPRIPLKIRLIVALRQIGEPNPEAKAEHAAGCQMLKKLLDQVLMILAAKLECSVDDLRLDHDPALENRRKVFRKGVHVDYIPPANSPDDLIYREKHAHHIKTNVRGDGAQYADNVIAKRERRR